MTLVHLNGNYRSSLRCKGSVVLELSFLLNLAEFRRQRHKRNRRHGHEKSNFNIPKHRKKVVGVRTDTLNAKKNNDFMDAPFRRSSPFYKVV